MDESKVGYKEFFDFSDGSVISEAIKNMKSLKEFYEGFVSSLHENKSKTEKALKGVNTELEEQLKTIKALNLAVKEDQSVFDSLKFSTLENAKAQKT